MKIVAIGGGNKEPMIRDAAEHARNSNVLIVPTACSTETSYNKKVAATRAFFDTLGLPNVVLHKLEETPTPTQVDHEFGQAGIAYFIGGHTPTMLRLMHRHGTDKAVRQGLDEGLTMAGTSAGALAPFASIHSCPAKKPAEEHGWDYVNLHGLGILQAAATAHANQHDPTPNGLRPDSRLEHLATHFPGRSTFGFGIDNGAALIVRDNEGLVLTSAPDANVHILRAGPEGEPATVTAVQDAAHLTDILLRLPGDPLRTPAVWS